MLIFLFYATLIMNKGQMHFFVVAAVCVCVCVCIWMGFILKSLDCVAFILLLLDSHRKIYYIYGAANNSGIQCPPLILFPWWKCPVKGGWICVAVGETFKTKRTCVGLCPPSSGLETIENASRSLQILFFALMLENLTLLFNILLM